MPVTQISARQRINAGGGGGGGAVTVAGITDAGAEGRLALLTTTQAELTALLAEATLVDKGLLASSVLQTIYNLGSVSQWNSVEAGDINGLAAIAISGLASDLSGTLALAKGGTGQITALAAADALSAQSANIAGGNTVDLATVTGPVVIVTGGAGVTISSFGVRPTGAKQLLIFASSGAAIIHNGGALICPFGASIGVQAGDVYEVTSTGAGTWRVTNYLPVTSAAWKTALGLSTLATSGIAADITDATAVGRSMLKAADQAAQTALIAAATTVLPGLMPAADKVIVNGLSAMATAPTAANITDATAVGRSMLKAADQAAQTLLIASATTVLAGLMSAADKVKVNGLATMATTATAANITDATTVGRAMLTAATAVVQTESLGSEIPTAGTNLTDANATLTIAGGAQYVMPAATLTANRVITLGVTGSPLTSEVIAILRRGTEAFTITVQDDAATVLLVMPASTRMAAYFRYNGTHFVAGSSVRTQ